jgi:hypothetical protein
MYEEHEKRIEKFQYEIERLIDERNQARDLLTQWKESSDEHLLNLEQIKQSSKIDVAIQTITNLDL